MNQTNPSQSQSQPGREHEMRPTPDSAGGQRGSGRLQGRTAIVTGGDSGIGRSVSVLFAREGADVTVVYLEEHDDYSATKGAIVAFTRALSQQLVSRGIRVNAVAPGPIWTPLIPATFPPDAVESFGMSTPMGRPGEPDEVAPCYVFLASDDASYMAGQVLHPNGRPGCQWLRHSALWPKRSTPGSLPAAQVVRSHRASGISRAGSTDGPSTTQHPNAPTGAHLKGSP